MKSKFLLTVLFSIGIIGITSAQGLARNDFSHGPRHEAVSVYHHEPGRGLSRHERRQLRREERREHRRMMRRHFRRHHF